MATAMTIAMAIAMAITMDSTWIELWHQLNTMASTQHDAMALTQWHGANLIGTMYKWGDHGNRLNSAYLAF
jgi:hypothetical protein